MRRKLSSLCCDCGSFKKNGIKHRNMNPYEAVDKANFDRHLEKQTGCILSCPHCSYRTVYNKNLKVHLGKRTGNMLKCTYCSYEAVRRGDLNQHIKRHTAILFTL